MEFTLPVIPGCNCPSHREIFDAWPKNNAILRVSSCMRICPYCGTRHSNASRLRKHLKGYTYRSRNLTVEAEHAGIEVRKPQWSVATLDKNSTSKIVEHSDSLEEGRIVTVYHGNLQSASPVRQTLEEIQECFGAAFSGLNRCDLYPLGDVPPTVRSLWQSCTTSVPTLYNSSQCWTVRIPSARDLVIDALVRAENTRSQPDSEEDFRVSCQGEVNGSIDHRIVLAQLIDPDPVQPIFLTGLRLPSAENYGFRCPYDLCAVVEPEEECNVQVNMTPKYSFVDLHIDYGADGLSTLVGECRKIWLLYPPSEANLRAMKTVDSHRAKLSRIMHQLEGGIIAATNASHAIYIPAGCIHATFTLQGGFLITKDFTTSESLAAIASYLLHGLDRALSTAAREICYEWFERCLDVCLCSGNLNLALEAWVHSQDALAAWAASHRQWRVNVRRLWEQHLHDNTVQGCPCACVRGTPQFLAIIFTTTSIEMNTGESVNQSEYRICQA
uniref:JmjC domain-containing histone demethylation protein 1 n=1 Tax=Talaromyces marneffei PM1 TaxID=1077442 RepID=A0A093V791_TALMA